MYLYLISVVVEQEFGGSKVALLYCQMELHHMKATNNNNDNGKRKGREKR